MRGHAAQQGEIDDPFHPVADVRVEPEARDVATENRGVVHVARVAGDSHQKFASERAGGGAGKKVAARIVDLDAPARKFGFHAARDVAIRRHKRGGAAKFDAFAKLQRRAQSLLALVGGERDGDLRETRACGGQTAAPPESEPRIGGFGGSKGLAQKTVALRQSRGRPRDFPHFRSVEAGLGEQSRHRALRMRRQRFAFHRRVRQ